MLAGAVSNTVGMGAGGGGGGGGGGGCCRTAAASMAAIDGIGAAAIKGVWLFRDLRNSAKAAAALSKAPSVAAGGSGTGRGSCASCFTRRDVVAVGTAAASRSLELADFFVLGAIVGKGGKTLLLCVNTKIDGRKSETRGQPFTSAPGVSKPIQNYLCSFEHFNVTFENAGEAPF